MIIHDTSYISIKIDENIIQDGSAKKVQFNAFYYREDLSATKINFAEG